MRLWTLHPRYLDAQGLVALWREGLLAQKVLRGRTKGYRHHPQLARFRAASEPVDAIASYLDAVHAEAAARGYNFERGKIVRSRLRTTLEETDGQLLYEWEHLKAKLQRRSPMCYAQWRTVKLPDPHPLFYIVAGEVRAWERRDVTTNP